MAAEVATRHHRTLADALAARPEADPEQIAGHLLGAGETQRAGDYFARAAARADRELGFERAARLYGYALEHGDFADSERHRLRVARARVFAQAGRGAEAAAVYVEASAGASRKEAVELLQRAAQQYLLVGQLARGWKLLAQALAAAGIRVPRTTTGTVVSLAYHEARLRRTKCRWVPRSGIERALKQRINMLLAASHAIVRLDPARAAELANRAALLALKSGDARSIGRTLVPLAVIACLLGKDAAELDMIVDAVRPLVERSDDVPTVRWWVYANGFMRTFGPRYEPSVGIEYFEQYLRIFDEHSDVPQASYDRAWTDMNRALSLVGLGDFRATGTLAAKLLDEAWQRNDLCVVPMLAGRTTSLVGIASDDTRYAEQQLRRARHMWVTETTTLQEQELATGEWLLHTYAGRLREAWRTADEWHARLRRSPMQRSAWYIPDAQLARGLLAAALARTDDRAHWTRIAERVRRESRLLLVRCALECLRGERDAAIATLRAVEHVRREGRARPAPGKWFHIHEHAARRRLGELSGDAKLIESADAFFIAGGVRDPQRFVRALLPGLEI